MKTECKEVIITSLERRGKGVSGSPFRRVLQVYEKDGTLIAENDPIPEKHTPEDMIDFGNWLINHRDTGMPVTHDTVMVWIDQVKK